jgi:hypothetical protein
MLPELVGECSLEIVLDMLGNDIEVPLDFLFPSLVGLQNLILPSLVRVVQFTDGLRERRDVRFRGRRLSVIHHTPGSVHRRTAGRQMACGDFDFEGVVPSTRAADRDCVRPATTARWNSAARLCCCGNAGTWRRRFRISANLADAHTVLSTKGRASGLSPCAHGRDRMGLEAEHAPAEESRASSAGRSECRSKG